MDAPVGAGALAQPVGLRPVGVRARVCGGGGGVEAAAAAGTASRQRTPTSRTAGRARDAGGAELSGLSTRRVSAPAAGALSDADVCSGSGGPYSASVRPRISRMISSEPPPIGPRRASRAARSTQYSRM